MNSYKIGNVNKVIEIMYGIVPTDYLCRSDGKFSYSIKYIPYLYSVDRKFTLDLLGKEKIIWHNLSIKFEVDNI
jgi:hypothetical protein